MDLLRRFAPRNDNFPERRRLRGPQFPARRKSPLVFEKLPCQIRDARRAEAYFAKLTRRRGQRADEIEAGLGGRVIAHQRTAIAVEHAARVRKQAAQIRLVARRQHHRVERLLLPFGEGCS